MGPYFRDVLILMVILHTLYSMIPDTIEYYANLSKLVRTTL